MKTYFSTCIRISEYVEGVEMMMQKFKNEMQETFGLKNSFIIERMFIVSQKRSGSILEPYGHMPLENFAKL